MIAAEFEYRHRFWMIVLVWCGLRVLQPRSSEYSVLHRSLESGCSEGFACTPSRSLASRLR